MFGCPQGCGQLGGGRVAWSSMRAETRGPSACALGEPPDQHHRPDQVCQEVEATPKTAKLGPTTPRVRLLVPDRAAQVTDNHDKRSARAAAHRGLYDCASVTTIEAGSKLSGRSRRPHTISRSERAVSSACPHRVRTLLVQTTYADRARSLHGGQAHVYR